MFASRSLRTTDAAIQEGLISHLTPIVLIASGQWTIRYLLAAGAKVHAIVRDSSKIADVLKSPGVTVFKEESATFDDVFQVAQGCVEGYLNTFHIPGLETQQAKTILEALKKAGLKSVVACSIMGMGDKTLQDDDITEQCHLRDYYRYHCASYVLKDGSSISFRTHLECVKGVNAEDVRVQDPSGTLL
ncbi:hypothetical protein HD806DRAFT_551285 [Xylariaceae sp. AK1471]|nr:hypothetical protein HD806DRAFT_551285 [Xylariaceae sp. AK1471]